MWIPLLSRFHGEVAVDGGTACPDDLANVSGFEALFFEYMGSFDVGVGGGDLTASAQIASGVGGDAVSEGTELDVACFKVVKELE